MTLHQFEIFAVIARRGNFTRAALELRTTQPALTHQMKLLQEWYGAALYMRKFGGVVLTPAGERLLLGIGPILEMVGKLRPDSTAADPHKAGREKLRVGGVESASVQLLPLVLARFHARHPEVALEFRTRTSEQLERLVLSAAMDLAVTARRPVAADLHCEPLRKERVALFVAAGHRLAKHKRLDIAELRAEPLIVRGGGDGGRVTDQALQQLRDRFGGLKIGMYCDGPAAIKAAVAQRMGVGMVFEEALRADVAAGKFKILKIPGLTLEGESYVIYSKGRAPGPWAEEFLQLLFRAVNQQAASSLFDHAPTALRETGERVALLASAT
jgi:DNA-binding transcriptional LysR family regulator